MSQITNIKFNNPIDLSVDKHGYIFIADNGNNSLRVISPSGIVATILNNVDDIRSVVVDNERNVYFLNQDNNIRKINSEKIKKTFNSDYTLYFNDTENIIINKANGSVDNKYINKLFLNNIDNDLYVSTDPYFQSYNQYNINDQTYLCIYYLRFRLLYL